MEGLFRGDRPLANVRLPADPAIREWHRRRSAPARLQFMAPPGAQRRASHIPTPAAAAAEVERLRRRMEELGLPDRVQEGLERARALRERTAATPDTVPQAGSAQSSLADMRVAPIFDQVDDAGLQALARNKTGPMRDRILQELARRAERRAGMQ